MNLSVTSLAVLLLVCACAAGPRPPDGEAATGAVASSSGAPVNLSFFDSRIFDDELSRAMKAQASEIVVDVPVGFSLNEIPPRVDRWLYSVKDAGGEVSAEPEVRTRGILSAAIDVVVSFVGHVGDYFTFAPSDRYSATLVYKPDGKVSRMVFVRR
ncbi:MAG: hypothetical protein AB7P21_27260 [Lautropia sp.]